VDFHSSHPAGDLVERIDGDSTTLANFCPEVVIQVFGSALLILGILVVLLSRDRVVGSALTAFAALALIVLVRNQGLGIRLFVAEREVRTELSAFLEERLGGIDDIRANAGTHHVIAKLDMLQQSLLKVASRAIRTATLFSAIISNGLFIFGYGFALALGIWLFSQGRATVGSVYLIVQYTVMLRGPLETIGSQAVQLQRARASLERLGELFALQPTLSADGDQALPRSALSVEFRNVHFAYHPLDAVLSDLDFDIEAGSTVALLGRTGSGKTTIARLLCRLCDASKGEIRLSGTDIKRVSLVELRRCVSMVTQDIRIFRATVRDNLTFFGSGLADEELRHALDVVGLSPWFARAEQGLDTFLHHGAAGMSAGEAQLFALARVFLSDSGLIVLDEVSSRLDPTAEQKVERAITHLQLRRNGEPRTMVVIAHRLQTVRRLENIMLVDAGRIIEYGQQSSLALDSTSQYHRLLRSGLADILA
jgi:ABC-type multidrug transport system fused ATPase/permease subunit